MVAQRDKEIKKELGLAVEHLQLHGAATLEGAPATNDEGEIVRPQLRVRVGSVGIGVACRGQDGAALDARL